MRHKRWIAVILMDLDGFKSVNDINGHLAADRVLQIVASSLQTSIRKRDKAGRFGGDEFLIVLPETGAKGAFQVAERIRQSIETTIRTELNLTLPITASLGIAVCRTDGPEAQSLLEHADVALYRAKSLGRNRTEIWKKSHSRKSDR